MSAARANPVMSERRKMKLGDWFNTAINVLIGLLLGSVGYGLAQLVADGAWLAALIIVILGAGLFGFMLLSDKLFDLFLPSAIRPAKNPEPQPPKPLLRVLSLPIGFVFGVVLAILDLDRTILALLP